MKIDLKFYDLKFVNVSQFLIKLIQFCTFVISHSKLHKLVQVFQYQILVKYKSVMNIVHRKLVHKHDNDANKTNKLF